ncbi:MAG: indoleacetamide hydrolase [Betaproteobacteria bacterium]|nr:indoleacetamide hydrolase [Betaproteobacteria bacterium]
MKTIRTLTLLTLACLATAQSAVAASDPTQLSASEAVALLKAGKISSEQLTQAYLDKAKANGDLNAFITLDEKGALAAARTRDAEHGKGRGKGALNGLPIVVKDNIQVAGLPNTAGTPGLKDFVAKADAPVVARLKKAGAIVLGTTNMHELAFGISGYNEGFHGSQIGVRNAYDRTRFAGGSSSGTGAAIGARLAPAGLGSDTGGSARIPAAVNGIAGFRPSVLRYSQDGIAPISHTRDTAGILAQTVADVALLDAVITGGKPVKPANIKGARLGVMRSYFFQNLDADTTAVMEKALAKLKEAGAEIVEVDMPGLADLNNAQSFPIALYEAYDDLQAYLKRYGTGHTVEGIAMKIASKDVKGTYDGLVIPRKLPGPNNTLVDAKPIYEAAMKEHRPKLQKLYADTFKKHRLDALVFPTTPKVAIAQNAEASSLANFGLFIQNTDPGSNAGIPGLSIPAGLGASGQPVGLEIDGPAKSDRRLLVLGMAIEKTLGRLPAPTVK